MNDLIDAYNKEILCTYEGETYSVRDNGAILRHSKEGSRKRRNDNIWTLGIVNKENGYLLHSGVRVHRIVANAFLGEAPTKEHVVDHINTNKQDNRPENLRWVTKLENIILNPITCKKIMWMTGKTIDYVLQHIEILHDLNLSPDIQWMRTVTLRKARIVMKIFFIGLKKILFRQQKNEALLENGFIKEDFLQNVIKTII